MNTDSFCIFNSKNRRSGMQLMYYKVVHLWLSHTMRSGMFSVNSKVRKKYFRLCISIKLWVEFKEHLDALRCSVVEEAQVSVHQSDALLITGINDNGVSSWACRSGDVLNTTLQTDTQGRHITDDALKAWQFTTVSEWRVSKLVMTFLCAQNDFSRCLQAIAMQFLNMQTFMKPCFREMCRGVLHLPV